MATRRKADYNRICGNCFFFEVEKDATEPVLEGYCTALPAFPDRDLDGSLSWVCPRRTDVMRRCALWEARQ